MHNPKETQCFPQLENMSGENPKTQGQER